MNLVRCENGHFYDADRFSTCPHCTGGAAEQPPVDSAFATGGGVIMDSTMPYSDFNDNVFDTPTAPHTMPFQDTQQSGSLSDLVEQVQQVSQAAPAPAQEEQDDNKTVRYQALDSKSDPVVGWLVCIGGEELGKSYMLKSGRNFIGRSDNMDVVIKGDQSVSRDKHAILLYDPKSRLFLVQPGDSHELFYLNDQVVLTPTQLNVNDKLQIGATMLVFVPFCGPSFAWEDLEKNA